MFWMLRISVICIAFLLCSCISTTVPSFARDSFGLIDLTGKEIIPCKYRSMEYVGCGFYLAEEMPDARTQPTGAELLSAVPKELLAFISNHEWYSAKVLLTRNGKRVSVPIPRDAILTDIVLPSREQQWDSDKHERPAVFNNGRIPRDAFLCFVNRNGFGVCNAIGEVLVEPNIRALERAKERDGFLLDLYSAARLFYPKQTEVAARPRSEHHRSVTSEGLEVRSTGNFYYFADKNGKKVSPAYAFAKPFADGKALVGDKPPIRFNFRKSS